MARMSKPTHRPAVGSALLAAFAAVLVLAAPVAAHAALVSGDPAPGSTLASAPTRVSSTFDDDLDASKSSIVVVGPGGATVGQGGVSPDDPKTLVATITSGAPGAWEVRWTAATPDGHIERGTYGFTVSASPTASPAPPASPSPATGTPVPSAAGTGTPGPSAAPGPGEGAGGDGGIGLVLAAAVGGLLLGVGIGWWRRRRGAS